MHSLKESDPIFLLSHSEGESGEGGDAKSQRKWKGGDVLRQATEAKKMQQQYNSIKQEIAISESLGF